MSALNHSPIRKSSAGKCMKSRLGILFTGLIVALALLGCQESKEPEKKESVPVGITGINHTTTYIADFYVEDAWGANISSVQNGGGGGSGNTCCVILPYRYRSGLTAKVRWNHTESRIDNWKETLATILPYPDGAGQAWVNFLPDDRVVILVSNFAPWHEKYQGGHKSPSHPDYRGPEIEFPKNEGQP